MHTDQIRLLLDLAQTNSFNQTAERHFTTQQSISYSIKQLEKELNVSVQREIEKRLAGSTPAKVVSAEGLTKEDFNKMTLSQQQQLYNSNPDLYKALI